MVAASEPFRNCDSLKRKATFKPPSKFQHKEIGTETSRCGAVLGSMMPGKFMGKWVNSKESTRVMRKMRKQKVKMKRRRVKKLDRKWWMNLLNRMF